MHKPFIQRRGKMKKTLVQNSVWILLNQLVSRGILVLASIVLARFFQPGEFAQFGYFQITSNLFVAYASAGLGVSASRFFAEFSHRNDSDALPPLGTLWAASVLLALMASVVVFILPGQVFGNEVSINRPLISTAVFFLVIGVVPAGAAMGLELYKKTIYVSFVSSSALMLGVASAILFGEIRYALVSLIFAIAIQSLGESLIVFWRVGRSAILDTLAFGRDRLRQIYAFGGPMVLVSMISASGAWLMGRLVIEHSGQREFAIYSIGLQWFALAMFLPGLMSRAFLPMIIGLNKAGGGSRNATHDVARLALLCALAISGVGALLSTQILRLYGHEYSGQSEVFIVFLAAAVFASSVNIFGNYMISKDRNMAWLIITVGWAIALVASWALIPADGAIRPAAAFLVSYFLMWCISKMYVHRMAEP